eukprot:TRINITY_DN28705_c0_g2_i1.p1 TRINITY_DN28705_c0_g2~~TRINITY_DN28705_c0_g2_i1.p1  ORF type:complete len:637 (+),score=115.52 TRINITY_DN28705_c0_g2_i1:68-1912(+)
MAALAPAANRPVVYPQPKRLLLSNSYESSARQTKHAAPGHISCGIALAACGWSLRTLTVPRKLLAPRASKVKVTSTRQNVRRRGIKDALRDAVTNLLQGPEKPQLVWNSFDDDDSVYDDPALGVYANHFRGHRALTTKEGIMRSLAAHPEADSFFPRCYRDADREEFVQDYLRQAAFIVVMKHLQACDASKAASPPPGSEEAVMVAMKILRGWHKELTGSSEQGVSPRIEQAEESLLLRYYRVLRDGFQDEGGKPDEMPLDHSPRPVELMKEIEELTATIADRWPQTSLLKDRNIWIGKHPRSSKGRGIHCFDDLKDILSYLTLWFDRAVLQKYLERPLLLRGRKFDLRQWVLVTSVQPLQAYIFSEPYLRMCGREYDDADLGDVSRHLSNWAVFEGAEAEESVMSLSDFKAVLEESTGSPSIWEDKLRPQLEHIVTETLRSVQKKLVHHPRRFALFGYDLIVDEDLKLWLLEVNYSPACEERQEVLSVMLRRMIHRLVEIVCLGKTAPDGHPLDWSALPLIEGLEAEEEDPYIVEEGGESPYLDLTAEEKAELEEDLAEDFGDDLEDLEDFAELDLEGDLQGLQDLADLDLEDLEDMDDAKIEEILKATERLK